ncbi:MAG: M23 family metallopeptidase [Cyanobacteria bacterium SZAS-4]|nr:M23 family metallopeptidase [Cyanobacteria bacterium SZAS-4]
MRQPIVGALVLFALAVTQATCADAPKLCTQEDLIHLHQEDIGETGGRLVLDPPQQIAESTISVDLDLENMTASSPRHFVYRVDGLQHSFQKPVELVRFSQKNAGDRFQYHWKYHWMLGLPGGRHDDSYVYALPYQKGEHHLVSQSYFGSFSHQKGTPYEYAVDFIMPEGTPVCAAREGIVVNSYGDSTVGGNDKKYEFCGNVVSIKHSDGTYARYVHLQPHGNLVRLGQIVHKGDRIGLSGKTGFADRPHLHFCVTVPLDGYTEKSMPVVFATEVGNLRELRAGGTY